jgi:hypothetical protein
LQQCLPEENSVYISFFLIETQVADTGNDGSAATGAIFS